MVEFRRTSGECLKFHEAYKKLRNLLSDLSWDDSDEVQMADDSPDEEHVSDDTMMV